MPLTCGRDQSSLVQLTEEELVDVVPHLNTVRGVIDY